MALDLDRLLAALELLERHALLRAREGGRERAPTRSPTRWCGGRSTRTSRTRAGGSCTCGSRSGWGARRPARRWPPSSPTTPPSPARARSPPGPAPRPAGASCASSRTRRRGRSRGAAAATPRRWRSRSGPALLARAAAGRAPGAAPGGRRGGGDGARGPRGAGPRPGQRRARAPGLPHARLPALGGGGASPTRSAT